MEPFIGQLMCVGFNFAPQGWAVCDGSLLLINENAALFSLIGAEFGGDGRSNFALPDLRGRIPIGVNLDSQPQYLWGHAGGSPTNTLLQANLPPHTHSPQMQVSSANASQAAATFGASLGTVGTSSGRSFTPQSTYNQADPDIILNADSVVSQSVGSGIPVNNMQPYLPVYWLICTQGTFPARP